MNNFLTPNMLSEPFDGTPSNWPSWVDRLKLAFHLYQVPSAMHAQYLLLLIGPATYQVLVDTLKCRDLSLFTFEKLTSTVEGTIYKTVMERFFEFAIRRQRSYETNEQFLLALTELWQSCPFGEFEDQALLNQFVLGLRDKQLQERLLKVESLTMDQAKIIALPNAPNITILRVETLPAYKPPPGFVQQTENLPDGANQSTNSNQYDTFVLGPNSIPNVPDAAGKSSYQTPLLQNMDLCTKPVKHDGTQFQLMDSANRMLNPINDSQTSRSPNPKAESTDSQAPYRSRSPSLTLESSKSSTSFYNPQLPKLSPPSDKRTNRSHALQVVHVKGKGGQSGKPLIVGFRMDLDLFSK